jgi:hypothetical protein
VSRLGIGRTILIFQRPGFPTGEGDEGEKDLVLVVAGWILLEVPIFYILCSAFCVVLPGNYQLGILNLPPRPRLRLSPT